MSDKHEEIVELLALTDIALEVGDRAQAQRYLSQLLQLDPAHAKARQMLQSLQPEVAAKFQEKAPTEKVPVEPPPAPPPQKMPQLQAEQALGPPFLAKCPVCDIGRLHWRQGSSISGQAAQILCTNCTSLLVPSGTQSSVGQFLFKYSEIDPAYAGSDADIWARSLTRQELAEIARQGAPRVPGKASFFVALSLGDFSSLPSVDPRRVTVPLAVGEQVHFLVEEVTYARRAAVESDNVEEIMDRVAQGISIMPVSFQTRPKMMELNIYDSGNLLITNQRYLFEGRRDDLTAELTQVLSIETYLDGVGIERSDGQGADYFLGMSSDQAAFTSAILRGALKNRLGDGQPARDGKESDL